MQVCHFQHLLRQFDKNEPGRFLGEGVSFRAKLIGVLEVPEARGDRMCQEALADLKMAIRAAGEHKQRIQVHVAIDGLRLRDDKTGDSLYHHPVHKISFIAQDMTDSRAFGYIFGSPDTGHRFFGIKTDKAASQVVIAMRDLFQVVFELKKKEVELAKQQLEGKTVSTSLSRHTSAVSEPKVKSLASVGETSTSASKAEAEGGVAELVDLEQELCSLRRGLTQVEGLTPSTDPFGDSFILPPQSTKGLLPPPPSGASSRGRNTPSARVFSPGKPALPFDLPAAPPAPPAPPAPADPDPQPASLVDNSLEPVQAGASAALSYHVFTELDPLGTGRSKPYVDKKLFFQELKNPPKKVLKDLVPATSAPPNAQSLISEILPDTKSEPQYGPSTTMTSLTRHSGGTVSIAKPSYTSSSTFFPSDPFAETDPFDNTDPFVDSFKDDPFTSMKEFPKSIMRMDDLKIKLSRESTLDKVEKTGNSLDSMKSVFNGPLQVSLPPEPVPKSPRLQRQNTDSSSVRQRPQPISKLGSENASPPPPLPPKKIGEITVSRPPPRPPHDYDDNSDAGPPLPRPARKKEPMADRSIKPRLSSQATNSSEDEYLTPAPPPLPSARRFDITLSQLLVCTMPELATRLRVPEATLSSMTLPQLTEYLRSYLAADNERTHIHIETGKKADKKLKSSISVVSSASTIMPIEKPITTTAPKSEFKPQFEDNFAPPDSFASSDTFVANFDDFDIKASASYDRYAAFREIQEQELKSKSILDPIDSPTKDEPKQDSDEKEELAAINSLIIQDKIEDKETSKSPLKSLDELTLDSFNMFRNSVSPKPTQPIEAKIEDIKSVMKNLQIDKSRRSVSPRENNVDFKTEDANDRYAALREITITEPQDEFESLPPEVPKERKRSDEKSDGFDNSDFFDCIDNSSLSFSHVEDAFRKSPVVKTEEVINVIKVEEKEEPLVEQPPVRDVRDVRETRDGRDNRDTRDIIEIRGAMDAREVRDLRDTIDARELRDNIRVTMDTRDVRDIRDTMDARNVRDLRDDMDARDVRDLRDAMDARDVRDVRDVMDARTVRDLRDTRDVRDIRDIREPVVPTRMSTGSISDVASGSSPDTKDKCVTSRATTRAGRWAVLGGTGASPWSSDSRDSEPRPRRRRGPAHHSPPAPRPAVVQTSSSSRDVSPWDEEPPPVARLPRPPSHHRDRDRESSRHGSSGSRECLDSGSGREKDKREKRDSRDRDLSRDGGRDSARDRRDSGSGRDRRDSKERDIREHRGHRDRRSRDRDRDRENDSWDRDRTYSRERDYRDSRSRERKDYRDKDRDRHRKPRHSYDEDEDYSDGCGSGRSSSRDRWPDQRWRRDERNYGSLGWRESRRRNEIRQTEDPSDRRYGSTLGWGSRSARGEGRRGAERERDSVPRERDPLARERDPLPRERDPLPRERDPLPRERDPLPRERDPLPRERDPRRRQRREEQRRQRNDYRFSNDFSPREREHTSPFDNDFTDSTPKDYIPTPTTKKRPPYSSLEGTRFSFSPEEGGAGPGASPQAAHSARARDGDAAARFRFDSDSLSPRSMFEDDFTNLPRGRTASIAEEEECDVPPLRMKPQTQRDIKKSESVNIFTRESDPFEGDAFFACTGSDRAARREGWPGDLHGAPHRA